MEVAGKDVLGADFARRRLICHLSPGFGGRILDGLSVGGKSYLSFFIALFLLFEKSIVKNVTQVVGEWYFHFLFLDGFLGRISLLFLIFICETQVY